MRAGNTPAEEVFSRAWQQVLAGRSVDAVLADYPEHAAELAPLLRLARQIHALPSPALAPDALATLKQQMQQQPPRVERPRRPPWFAPLLAPVQISAGLLLLLVLGLAAALLFAATRPAPDQPPAVVGYSGTITHMDGQVWQVDDTTVLLDEATEVHGQPKVGAVMRCIAVSLGPDKLLAYAVWVRDALVPPTPGSR